MKANLTVELDKDDLWVIIRALQALMDQPDKPDMPYEVSPEYYEIEAHQRAKEVARELKAALLDAATITVVEGVTLRDD